MPLSDIPGISMNASLPQVNDYLIMLRRRLNDFLNHLDTLNVDELDAGVINTGILNAALVTISSTLAGGAFIKIDSTGMTINDGTKDVFKADTNGNVTVTGGTIRTNPAGSNRVELSSNSLKTYNSSDQLNGLAWGNDVAGATFGDAYFYNLGSKLLEFINSATNVIIRGSAGAARLTLGGSTAPTHGAGTWVFESTNGSVDMQGTFQIHTGTAFDTITQANSTAADVATLVNDFNTLLSNLRTLNILA